MDKTLRPDGCGVGPELEKTTLGLAPESSSKIAVFSKSRVGAARGASDVDLRRLPDGPREGGEATIHALFEVAMQREAMPPDRHALSALIQKYNLQEESRQ